MSPTVDRLKHHAKIIVGSQIERFLSKQFLRGRGPVRQVISAFSNEARKLGIESDVVVYPTPVAKLIPEFFLDREIDRGYRDRLLIGEDFTKSAGLISADNVDVSFPTSMHRVNNRILEEVIPAPYVLNNPKYYYGFESMRFKTKRRMGEAVFLSMPWYHNFYHWMIEVLPRLISYDRSFHLKDLPLIMPKTAPGFVMESLKATGYLSRTVFLENGVYNFKKLHLLSSLAGPASVSTDAVRWLNEKFVDLQFNPRVIAPKRLYVSRSDAKIRFVSNEHQLADVLSEFGFEVLSMSNLSLADQFKVFRGAECIIGPHGAAFANLAFANPGSTFIEFFSRPHFNPCFNRISGIRRLRYGLLVGEPSGMGGFSIDPVQLWSLLSGALRS